MTDETPREDTEVNPYQAPETTSAVAAALSKLPGWLVLFFGIVGLLLFGLGGAGSSAGEMAMAVNNNMNAVLYGLPGAIAALVFGFGNVRVGKDTGLSSLGVVVACFGILGGAYNLYMSLQ